MSKSAHAPRTASQQQATAEHAVAALLESRARWRDLATLAADLAFETDADGRFAFVAPDPALGWPAGQLIGAPAEVLLGGAQALGSPDPFHLDAPMRRQRVWLRRADGTMACLLLGAVPLLDRLGQVVGARGMGIDITEASQQEDSLAAALRRGAMVDHILGQMRHELLAHRMMEATLAAMLGALGAEGAAVIEALPDGAMRLLHEAGSGTAAALAAPTTPPPSPLATAPAGTPRDSAAPDGRLLIAVATPTRFSAGTFLLMWRPPGGRPWDEEERRLLQSAAGIARVALEHEEIQHEMARQARTDPLTGLLNRRAFLEALPRRIERLDREGAPGTLVYVDLDRLKLLNDTGGHELGDAALKRVAQVLRDSTRPSDLVARLGGDEFAMWLDGADRLTAAERADALVRTAAGRLSIDTADGPVSLGFSIGFAERLPGSFEDQDGLLRRADLAMYEAKRAGRGCWRAAVDAVA